MRPTSLRLLLAGAATLFASAASASTITYPDYASWSSAAGSSITTLAIPDVPPSDPSDPSTAFKYFPSGSTTINGVSFSVNPALGDVALFQLGTGFTQNYPPVISSQVQSVGLSNILISFGGNINALSLDFLTFFPAGVLFTLSNGDVVTLGSSGFPADPTVAPTFDFFGITDNTSFNSILITSSDQVLNINNLAFSTPVAAIPEVSTWVMMLLGWATFGAMGYVWPRRTRLASR